MNRLALAASGCCLALLLAACGDNGEMSAAEYFAELEAAAITFDDDADASDTRARAIEDRVEGAREFFRGGLTVLKTLVSEVESLSPPADVREAHDRALANGRDVASALEGVINELEGVDTPSELGVVENSAALTALDSASDAFTQSCVELTQAAADNEITVDLRCD